MILDLFAGPGGWSEGLRMIGLTDVGIEWDAAACATRTAAGHLTVRADVARYPTEPFAGKVWGLLASPPCQDFSMAGNRAGRTGDKGQLIDEVPRWVGALRPAWVACEQVPPALEVWDEFAHLFRTWGYSTWAGILNSADYGVPQTRRRAILLASRVGVAHPPEPTHAETPAPSLFGPELRPWVSMADALGWGATERPVPTIHAGKSGDGRVFGSVEHGSNVALVTERDADRWVQRERSGDRAEEGFDPHQIPCQTITSKARSWVVDRRTNSRGPRGTTVPTVPVGMDRPSPSFTGKAGRVFSAPATTVAGDPRITARCHHDDGSQGADAKTTEQVRAGDYEGTEPIKLTVPEALILQSFRADYPVQGSRTAQFQQIGNAVPPLLAARLVGALARQELAAA